MAQVLSSNEEFSGLLWAFARLTGETDAAEDLALLLMRLMAEHALYGDCCDVQELPESQQWCID